MLVKVNSNLDVALNMVNHQARFGLLQLEWQRGRYRTPKRGFQVTKWKIYNRLRRR